MVISTQNKVVINLATCAHKRWLFNTLFPMKDKYSWRLDMRKNFIWCRTTSKIFIFTAHYWSNINILRFFSKCEKELILTLDTSNIVIFDRTSSEHQRYVSIMFGDHKYIYSWQKIMRNIKKYSFIILEVKMMIFDAEKYCTSNIINSWILS